MLKPWLLPMIAITLLFCGLYHLRNDLNYQESLRKAIYKSEEIKTLSKTEYITNDDVRAEQDQILSQLALRNRMHDKMAQFYVQARVFIFIKTYKCIKAFFGSFLASLALHQKSSRKTVSIIYQIL